MNTQTVVKEFPGVTITAQYQPVEGGTRLVEVWQYPDRSETFVEPEIFKGSPEVVALGHRWELYPDAR